MQANNQKKTLQFTRQLQHQLAPTGLSLNKRQSRRLSDDVDFSTQKISFSDSKDTRKDDDDDIIWQISYDDRLQEERRFDSLFLIENDCRSRSSCLDSSEQCSSEQSDESYAKSSQKGNKAVEIDTHSSDESHCSQS